MAHRHSKTIALTLFGISLLCLLLLVAVPAASAEAAKTVAPTTPVNATEAPTQAPTPTPAAIATPTLAPTPDTSATATPTSVASPTPAPTPAPRNVLSSAKWENDHVSMLVTNSGGPITVEGYIDNPASKITVSVPAGATVRVNTNSIAAESGQIIVFSFTAYENGTAIQTFQGSLVAGQTQVSPTPPPETASLSGTIVDAATNAPVDGADVVLKSQSYNKQYTAKTDSSGFYTVSSIYPDTYDLIITKEGYKQEIRHTNSKIEGLQTLDAISITKVPTGATPTPAATPAPTPAPSATPSSPLDAWISLFSSPQGCIATAGGMLGIIISLTVLYEWLQRQKERRKGGSQPPSSHPPAEQPKK